MTTTVRQHERRTAWEKRMAKRAKSALAERVRDANEPFFIDEVKAVHPKRTLSGARIARDVNMAVAVTLCVMNGLVR